MRLTFFKPCEKLLHLNVVAGPQRLLASPLLTFSLFSRALLSCKLCKYFFFYNNENGGFLRLAKNGEVRVFPALFLLCVTNQTVVLALYGALTGSWHCTAWLLV